MVVVAPRSPIDTTPTTSMTPMMIAVAPAPAVSTVSRTIGRSATMAINVQRPDHHADQHDEPGPRDAQGDHRGGAQLKPIADIAIRTDTS